MVESIYIQEIIISFIFFCAGNFDRSHHQQNKKQNQQFTDAETMEENNFSMNYEYEEQRSDMRKQKSRWNGIMGDLIAGSADMSFAPLTVSK
jgi:hypothetical protein